VESSYPLNDKPSATQIQALNDMGFWPVQSFPRPSLETQKIAYEAELLPLSEVDSWSYRHDFVFLKVERYSNIFFIPKAGIAHDTPGAIIGYVSLLDTKDLETKYKGVDVPSPYRLKAIFGGFDRKFISPGEIKEANAFLCSHRANAEASSSGSPVLALTDDFLDPYVFSGVHLGAFASAQRNFMLHTMHKAFRLEWATHVLPSLMLTFPATDTKRKQLTQYINAVAELLPKDDPTWPVANIVHTALQQLKHI